MSSPSKATLCTCRILWCSSPKRAAGKPAGQQLERLGSPCAPEAAELNKNNNSTIVIGQFQTANYPVGSSVGLVASPYGNASQCHRVAITNFVGRKDRFFLSSHPVTYAIRGSYRDCSALVDLLFGVAVSPTKAK